jgi:hypothetical protein
MLGVGLADVLTNFLRIICQLLVPNNLDASSQVFFYFAALFLFVCAFFGWLFVHGKTRADKVQAFFDKKMKEEQEINVQDRLRKAS